MVDDFHQGIYIKKVALLPLFHFLVFLYRPLYEFAILIQILHIVIFFIHKPDLPAKVGLFPAYTKKKEQNIGSVQGAFSTLWGGGNDYNMKYLVNPLYFGLGSIVFATFARCRFFIG